MRKAAHISRTVSAPPWDAPHRHWPSAAASAVRKTVAARTLAALASAASTRDARGRQMSGAQMRRWWRGIYADHTDRTRLRGIAAPGFPLRRASLIRRTKRRLRSAWPAPDGRGRPAPARRGRAAVSWLSSDSAPLPRGGKRSRLEPNVSWSRLK